MANRFTNKITKLGNREYISQSTAIFDSSTQETGVYKTEKVSSVKNIDWSVGSSGNVVLSWEGSGINSDEVFAVLSGNGRWELQRANFKKPETSTGRIKVNTNLFVSGDSYTIIILGDQLC